MSMADFFHFRGLIDCVTHDFGVSLFYYYFFCFETTTSERTEYAKRQ